MLGGVSGGLADYFDIDPVLVRLAWVVLGVMSGGLFVFAYLLLWVIVPVEGRDYRGRETMRQNFGEVADEARAFAGEVREAFRPSSPRSSTHDEPAASEGTESNTPQPVSAPTPERRDRQMWGALVLIAVGLIFLVDNLGIIPRFEWGIFWPVILIVIGLALIWRRWGRGGL